VPPRDKTSALTSTLKNMDTYYLQSISHTLPSNNIIQRKENKIKAISHMCLAQEYHLLNPQQTDNM
jgi:hypothetical protein